MNKKLTAIVLCSVLGLMMVCTAFAEAGITPRYAYTTCIDAGLSISGGVASARGSITPDEDYYQTSVMVRLQKYENGKWGTVAYWTASNTGGDSETGGSRAVPTGYKYRTYVTGTVYDSSGNKLESVSKYSNEVSH